MSDYIPLFEVAAFIACVASWPHIRKNSYLKLFPVLLFVVVATEVWSFYLRKIILLNSSLVYNIQVPLQHCLYLLILYHSLKNEAWKKTIFLAYIFFIGFTIITLLWLTADNRFNVLSYCVGSLFIILGILIKFYEMLQNPTDFNFLRNPFFYILFAYLLFNVGCLPYFLMSNWLYFIQTQKEIKLIYINVMSIFNYLLYTTYTLAFLWIRLKKAHY